jgi:putative FmdB family regulatory protein
MPFYEYQCKACGHSLEAMQKVSDSPLKKCPDCGKPQLQRLMSAPVFRLKGGGWYETDFKSDQDKKRNLADRPEADAATDLPKDGAKDAVKEASKGKDGNGKDAAAAGGAGAKDTPKDTAGAKPVQKTPASRSRTAASRTARSAAKRPVKKPSPKAKSRR